MPRKEGSRRVRKEGTGGEGERTETAARRRREGGEPSQQEEKEKGHTGKRNKGTRTAAPEEDAELCKNIDWGCFNCLLYWIGCIYGK